MSDGRRNRSGFKVTDYAPRGPCGKVKFASEKAAKLSHRQAGYRYRIYFCKQCHGWHTTNQDKAKYERFN